MTRPGFERRNSDIRTVGVIGALCLLASSTPALAQERALTVEMRPKGDPQIAVWLEDEHGTFLDTIMVTKLVGTFGLGNRPGRHDFGGGYLWPYGRREMALPVWAHRRNVQYDRVVFQDCRESSLGWHEAHSSTEQFYCRPTTATENSVDTITCPTTGFNTDKGIPVRLINSGLGPDCAAVAALPQKSYYPPRNDLARVDGARDWSGVRDYSSLNELDAVSRATPPSDQVFRVTYNFPAAMAPGSYVVWVEVNQQWDSNQFHHYDYFVDPQLRDYGEASIGQPSVVWKVPVTIGAEASSAQVKDYVGYGSPDGQDGDVRAPDNTITTNVPGSGAGRLLVMTNTEGDYRVRASFSTEAPCTDPEPVSELHTMGTTFNSVDLGFMPSMTGSMYEVRYALGSGAITSEDDFVNAVPGPSVEPGAAGAMMTVRLTDLQADTTYTIAVRSYDRCRQASRFESIEVHTDKREFATVDACFIATAAYGSKDEAHVVELRRFRDRVLMKSELGQAAVDTYYAVSPPIADAIRDSEILRFAVRTMLRPVVSAVRDIK